MTHTQILEQAKEVLHKNWKAGYTVPSPHLYPFQWNWDSGFVAIGYSHYNIERSIQELEKLFSSQRTDGFLPHIVYHNFNESLAYFPGPNFYNHELNPNHNGVKSTPLTQPPIHGFVLEKMYGKIDKPEHLEQWETLLKQNFQYHQYLYENRDLHNEGLVFITHNWESGTDNSPIWDETWERIEKKVPHFQIKRKDTGHVDASQRPSNREYDKYLYLINLSKEVNHNDKELAKKTDFLIQDPLFNAMLQASNKSMLRLFKMQNMEKEAAIVQQWIQKTEQGFEKLWNEKEGTYVHYDLILNKQINGVSSSSFAPLYAQIPSQEKANKMVHVLNERFSNQNQNYLCASFDPKSAQFESQRYWRGPIWVNLNWLIHHGLNHYGHTSVAEQIKNDTLKIIEEQGFYEYFEPDKEKSAKMNGIGYGGEQFSWSAALVIDFLMDKS